VIAIHSDHVVSPKDSGIGYDILSGYIVIEGENIKDVLPSLPDSFDGKVYDFGKSIIMPAIVEPHTHAIFGGDRASEFHMRMQGVSYVEIAKAGGGILSTMSKTRQASDEELASLLKKRLDIFLKNGALTVEVKSGYDLTHEGEIRLLKIIRNTGAWHDVDVYATYLGAHAVPKDRDRNDYIEEIVDRTLPEIREKELADFIDVFCDETAYNVSEALKIFTRAKELGFAIKVHAEELKHTGISKEAAKLGALSADHLIKVEREDLTVMKEHGTIPTLLPPTVYLLKEDLTRTLRLLDEIGMPFAMATDFNPGSSPVISTWTMVDIAITRFGIPLERIIPAITIMAARALGLSDRGQVNAGKKAYLIALEVDNLEYLGYLFGVSPVKAVFKGEHIVYEHEDSNVWI
jgi:imidazolonepropionase